MIAITKIDIFQVCFKQVILLWISLRKKVNILCEVNFIGVQKSISNGFVTVIRIGFFYGLEVVV